jgi:hypothetical protein
MCVSTSQLLVTLYLGKGRTGTFLCILKIILFISFAIRVATLEKNKGDKDKVNLQMPHGPLDLTRILTDTCSLVMSVSYGQHHSPLLLAIFHLPTSIC